MKKKSIILSLFVLRTLVYTQESTVESPDSDVTTAEITADSTAPMVETPVEEPQNSRYTENLDYTLVVGDKYFASPKAQFSVQGVDAQSGLKEILVSVDGSIFAPYKQPISFPTEGEHTILYKFIDHVGNESYSQPFSVTIDATPPRVLDLVLDPPPFRASGFEYVGPNTAFEFNAFDDMTGVSHVEYTVNGSEKKRFYQKTAIAELGFTETDVLTFSYDATDKVGNTSAVQQESFVLDATPPKVHVFADKAFEKDGVRYMSNRDYIIAEAFDYDTGVAKILYSISGEEFAEYDPQVGIRIEKEGTYTVRVKAIDMVGNISDDFLYDVVIDAIPPQGSASYVGYKESQNSRLESLIDRSQKNPSTRFSRGQKQGSMGQSNSQVSSSTNMSQRGIQNQSGQSVDKENLSDGSMSEDTNNFVNDQSDTSLTNRSDTNNSFSELAPDEEQVNMNTSLTQNNQVNSSSDDIPCRKILEEE